MTCAIIPRAFISGTCDSDRCDKPTRHEGVFWLLPGKQWPSVYVGFIKLHTLKLNRKDTLYDHQTRLDHPRQFREQTRRDFHTKKDFDERRAAWSAFVAATSDSRRRRWTTRQSFHRSAKRNLSAGPRRSRPQ